jgi:hypothetical protein
MARTPSLVPSVKLTTALPLDVITQLNAHLYSELEGRVPFGSHQRFFTEQIRAFFSDKHLDLAPYLGTSPGAIVVSGTPEAIELLKGLIYGQSNTA